MSVDDLEILRRTVKTKLNLEMAATQEMVRIALRTRPEQVTLVPEKRKELTTEGGLDVLANAKKYTNDSMQFTFDLLERAGVGVAPGVDFGPGGEGYIRFSYANSIENIEEGMRRLEKYLGELS